MYEQDYILRMVREMVRDLTAHDTRSRKFSNQQFSGKQMILDDLQIL